VAIEIEVQVPAVPTDRHVVPAFGLHPAAAVERYRSLFGPGPGSGLQVAACRAGREGQSLRRQIGEGVAPEQCRQASELAPQPVAELTPGREGLAACAGDHCQEEHEDGPRHHRSKHICSFS
jgi:hypothetical protein